MTILSLYTHNGDIFGNKWLGHYGHFDQKVNNGFDDRTIKDQIYDFYGCPVKEWSKYWSPMTIALKMMVPVKSYGRDKTKITRSTIGAHGYKLFQNELFLAISWYNILSNNSYLVSSFCYIIILPSSAQASTLAEVSFNLHFSSHPATWPKKCLNNI